METSIGPARYEGFDRMPIGGDWRAGGGAHTLTDTDPWSGEAVAEISEAGLSDVEEAYAAAALAQR